MMRHLPLPKKAALGAAFFMVSFFLLLSCSKTPDEEQIALILDEMVTSIEGGKPADIGKHLHKEFRANRQMDVQQVRQMLMMVGMQHSRLSVTRLSTETTVDPVYTDKAETVMSVVVTGFGGHGLPDDGSARVVRMEWRRDGDWKLLKADWEE